MKKLVASFLILFLATGVSAQQKQVEYAATPNSLLWEVSGKHLKEPSYLFGTYHLAGRQFLDTLPGVRLTFTRARTVVGEFVFKDELKLAMEMMPFMVMKSDKLNKLLSTEEYQEVDDYLRRAAGMQLSMFNTMKPSVVQVTLLNTMSPVKPAPDDPAVDKYFQQEALKQNKEIIGLETIDEQAQILFGMPLQRQKELLLKTVRESDRVLSQARELFEYYKAQNLEALEKSFVDDTTDYKPEEMDVLLKNRNVNWMKKLPAIMAKQSAFIAVGAGHLVSETGLIALLRKSGYTVRPVNTKL